MIRADAWMTLQGAIGGYSWPDTELKVTHLTRPELSLAELLTAPWLLDYRMNTAGLVLFQNIAPSWRAFLELHHQATCAEKPAAFAVVFLVRPHVAWCICAVLSWR